MKMIYLYFIMNKTDYTDDYSSLIDRFKIVLQKQY